VSEFDKSPNSNWVERAGGLPHYVVRIARHVAAKGHTDTDSIKIAIATARKWCATGEVYQWPGIQMINLGRRSEACAAIAEWDAKRAAARASKSI
jgi:hypothetical protein